MSTDYSHKKRLKQVNKLLIELNKNLNRYFEDRNQNLGYFENFENNLYYVDGVTNVYFNMGVQENYWKDFTEEHLIRELLKCLHNYILYGEYTLILSYSLDFFYNSLYKKLFDSIFKNVSIN